MYWPHGQLELSQTLIRPQWRIVEDREPDVLQSVGPKRIGHDLTTEEQLILHWGNCASKDRWHFQRHVATK